MSHGFGTSLVVCKNVPLDITYRNTINFPDRATQSAYFNGKAKYILANYSYQRFGVARVEKTAEQLYDCNYLVYQNGTYGDKVFYAFITKIDYVNDAVSDIYFETDVMQTWLFDWDFKKTYVVRATPNSDSYGSNILPEPIVFPEVAYANVQLSTAGISTKPEPMAYVFGTTEDILKEETAIPSLIGACPTACFLYGYTEFTEFSLALSTAIKAKDNNVQFAFAIPQRVHNAINGGKNGRYPNQTKVVTTSITIPQSTLRTNYNGSIWSKSLVYPYQALIVMTPNGYMEFDPSGFAGDAVFKITYTISPTPSYIVTCNYQDKTIELDGGTYPTIPFANSQYPQYMQAKLGIAQELVTQAQTNAMGALTPVVTGLANGTSVTSVADNVASAAVNLLNNTLSQDLQITQGEERLIESQMRTAPGMHGSSSDFGHMLIGRTQPTFYIKYLRQEYAKSLESFFSVKGYTKNQLVVPRKTSMKSYKYLQTLNCDIVGSVPAPDMRAICAIHDKGVTYWYPPESIGDYSG